ncbi:MAG: FAD-binding and (Fe-S)-binding domain-containing protein [Desulfobacterales bacterium]|jgi:D-lactate dehydrogenase
MAHDPHLSFLEELKSSVPASRLMTDPLSMLAHGTDASFYRLLPKIVVKTRNESEVVQLLQLAGRQKIPVTFRAAGTSLSGQAISDSVLMVAGTGWRGHRVLDGGDRIRVQPGLIGAQVNRILEPFGRKIGPDPASINSAMIGGIVANNASGMCCGTAQNSYQTIDSIRVVLADGTVLDTGDAESRRRFASSHRRFLHRLSTLAKRVQDAPALAKRIRQKFRIKNTTGYSLNALVDFQDPFEMITHLMVGSEGTLGFISEVTFQTVVEHSHKASALIAFSSIHDACNAAAILQGQPVAAAEVMDRAALTSVETQAGMPDSIRGLSRDATALLVETRSETDADLRLQVKAIADALDCIPVETPVHFVEGGAYDIDTVLECTATELPFHFTDKVSEYQRLWNVRKGLFPAVGAMRRPGTTVIIEDVAFPIESLAPATLDLQALFQRHDYPEAIIFGHALAGNLHFVFTQDFSRSFEVDRYKGFMDDVCDLVVGRYDGSLKAEHGTGRNMAPFVEMEWGADAYQLMQEIKDIFDPDGILNPGVILNDNPTAHIDNLKPLPIAHPVIDKCIECGFCEVNCPSRELTLTPRQRIVVQREMARLRAEDRDHSRLDWLESAYLYQGNQTCAVDGMCATSCPVAINTGDHTKMLRKAAAAAPRLQTAATLTADNLGPVTTAVRLLLKLAHQAHRTLGTRAMDRLARLARELSGNRLPLWNRWMPMDAERTGLTRAVTRSETVVYFPSCINRTMGPAAGDPDQRSLPSVTVGLLKKAGYSVVYPASMASLCCGTPFESKGFTRQADQLSSALEEALLTASANGRHPVLCDTSPCLERMRRTLSPALRLYEPVEFIHLFLMDRLEFDKGTDPIAVHVTCSSRKLGIEPAWRAVAEACAREVIYPDSVGCCGFAGDRGFSFPELTRSALSPLKSEVGDRCIAGYSNSRTCEIGLSQHSGLYYKSIIYLVDQRTSPKRSL